MTTSNTAAVATAAPKKMELATVIFNEINGEGYKIGEGVKSLRGEFVKRAMAEAGLTKAGAGTYFQSLLNVKNGKSKYYTSKKVKSAEGALAKTTEEANNSQVKPEGEIGAHRWLVINAEHAELSSWATKAKAKTEAKAVGGEISDRNAKPTETPAA